MDYIFKAIGDPSRREILSILKGCDMNAGEIAEHFDMTRPSISHHLDILKRAGLVNSKKDGQFIIYSLNTETVENLFNWIINLKKEEVKEEPVYTPPVNSYQKKSTHHLF